MRVSLLEKRESFYNILQDTLMSWERIETIEDLNLTTYLVNRYLNFVSHPNLSDHTFHILIEEYSTNQNRYKNLFQSKYVKYAIRKQTRAFFSHKKISLPKAYSSYLILGGNHRIRLFEGNLNSSYVILKTGENKKFIQNEVELRTEFQVEYAPFLFEFGDDWLREEYFEGKPLNRIIDEIKKQELVGRIIKNHIVNLLYPSKKQISVTDYLIKIEGCFETIINNSSINISTSNLTVLLNTVNKLKGQLRNEGHVDVVWSHGDFQSGNILVSHGNYKVIDWEASDKRMFLYDLFVLLGEIRTHGDLRKAFVMFEKRYENYEALYPLPSNWKLWLAVEELLFSVYEDCSVNFYQSGNKVVSLCRQIDSLLLS